MSSFGPEYDRAASTYDNANDDAEVRKRERDEEEIKEDFDITDESNYHGE